MEDINPQIAPLDVLPGCVRWSKYDHPNSFEGTIRRLAYASKDQGAGVRNRVAIREVKVGIIDPHLESELEFGIPSASTTSSDLGLLYLAAPAVDLVWTSSSTFVVADRVGNVTFARTSISLAQNPHGSGESNADSSATADNFSMDVLSVENEHTWSSPLLISPNSTLTAMDVDPTQSIFAVGDSSGQITVASMLDAETADTSKTIHSRFSNSIPAFSSSYLSPLMAQIGLPSNIIRAISTEMSQPLPSISVSNRIANVQSEPSSSIQTGLPVTHIKFASTSTLYSGSASGHVMGWDTRDASTARREPTFILRDQEGSSITALATHSANQHLISTGHNDGRISVWDARACNAPLSTLQAHSGSVTAIEFSSLSVSPSILTSSTDGSFCLFEFNRSTAANKAGESLLTHRNQDAKSSERFRIKSPEDVGLATLYRGSHSVVSFDSDVCSRHLAAVSASRELIHMPYPVLL